MVNRRISTISTTSIPSITDIRNSINRIRNSIYSITSVSDPYEASDNSNNEKRWRLSYLKKQFESLQLQKLFHRYTQRINHGYFSQFLLIQTCLSTIHFILVLLSNQSDLIVVLPDLIIYLSTIIISIIFLIITDKYVKQYPKLLNFLTVSAFLILFFTNLFLPLYCHYMHGSKIQPTYTIHIIISTHVFLNVEYTLLSFIIGLLMSLIHVGTSILVAYTDGYMLWQRILTDIIFLCCMNGLGIYFRHMNEIVKRRSFLDRRSYVESTLQVKFEEKQESELMSSIIPKHIIDRTREDIIKFWDKIENSEELPLYRPFEHPYLEDHENVTILFADIVKYTQMTTQLQIEDLLSTLNELFSRFDEASEDLKVLRIKFLGDCYYCVAGLPPEPAENHAEACVDLGLRMISIIADVRKRRNLTINMRIGIHSGKITSGIIGSIKWQYDIWSNDVDIANKMETEGQAGKVHITENTKNLLKKSYDLHPYKTVNNIETFLITPENQTDNQNCVETEINEGDKMPNHRRPTIYKKQKSAEMGLFNNDFDNLGFINDNTENNQRRSTIYKKKHPFSTEFIRHSNSSANIRIENETEMNENDDYHRRSTALNGRRSTLLNSLDPRISNSNLNSISISQRRTSLSARMTSHRKYTYGKRRTGFIYNIMKYEEMLRETSEELEKTIENMHLSKYEQWFQVDDMNRLFLTFKNIKSELRFFKTKDPLFKYYVSTTIILLFCLYFIQNLTLSKWGWANWPFYLAFAILILIFVPITWTDHLWTRHIVKYKDEIPQNVILKFFYNTSKFVTDNVFARITIYLIICILVWICVLNDIIDCREHENDLNSIKKQRFLDIILRTNGTGTNYCTIPWHMSQACCLAIVTSFLFLRIYMWIKFIYIILITAFYSYIMLSVNNNVFQGYETINYGVRPEIAHVIIVIFVTINLSLIDRQTEYMNRLDHSWYETLVERQKRAHSIHALNKMLLKNILPIHVAENYLDMTKRSYEPEHYNDVAVMFATLVDYSIEDMGPMFLKVMNQIICDFDILSVNNTFGRPIEKIKIAKWTYMAACGIAPGLGNVANIRRDQKNHPVICLIKFASSLMKQLENINREQQNIKLRIGISFGPIAAGVVGSRKPLYDIWGDPVNMASRMDTSGLPNHIQVLEHTSEIIQEFGYVCNYRDRIKIKGKPEPVATYFVALDKNFNLIKQNDNIS